MKPEVEPDYREFATSQFEPLRRLAYLTCGDWQMAEDAASTTLAKLYGRWHKITSPHAYAQRAVIRAAIDETRRPWRREYTSGDRVPDRVVADSTDAVDDRLQMLAAMRKVPPRQRAVLVLRYYEGLDVEQTAAVLGLRSGTVKSHTARGLATLRDALGVTEIPEPQPRDPKGRRYELRPA